MEQHTYDILYHVEDRHWWFCGRRAILKMLLDRFFPRSGGKNRLLLDLGCGTGRTMELLKDYGAVTGLDLSPQALSFAAKRSERQLVQADFCDLPCREGTFDVVTAMDVLEHSDDDREVLKGIGWVLRPGGTVFLFVPAFQSLWGPQDDLSHHRRRYKHGQFRTLVESAGFTVRRMTYANMLLFFPIWLGRKLLRFFGVRVRSENNINAPGLNGILKMIFWIESWLLRFTDLPFGVSLICVAEKKA